ncbi:alpha/beta fold hydrolase [Shewanella livingstonensis]|uniref:Alpha/beta fold hydrolase n=1 Tax=Shewanella livingstonensis TaxID=150120 RepID=A0A3G8LW44_9GAMM|nr:alpha/beta fold hydrolase [Shewanella livingstonensis]AZG73614.1 alpha/beta fold hydrolase [Shewanella livingstonensis]
MLIVNVEEIQLPLAHITLAAKRYGQADKPMILALHGWLDNADSFIPLAQALDQQNIFNKFQLLCIDWPGHGLSDHRPGRYPLHWVDYIYDLQAVIHAISQDTGPIILLGHSLGGIIASAYNACLAENIHKLILIEALSPLSESADQAKDRLRKGLLQQQRFNRQLARPTPTYSSMNIAIQARHQLTGLALPWCELITKRNMAVTDGQYHWRSDPRLKLDSLNRFTFEQVDALMTNSDTPCLLIVGHDGYKQLTASTEQAYKWFSNINIIDLPGDHHLHMGNAHQVAESIGAFILNSR